MTQTYTLFNGDCTEELRNIESDSVDSCVTDPPYGLSKEPDIAEVLTKWLAGEPYDHGHGGFMGKAWDSFVPHPDVWREVYRVLKPGGYALVFAGTRTQDLMTVSLRMAGFEVRDVIEWLYFSGFPKSMDVGKAFDRRRDDTVEHAVVARFIVDAMTRKGLTRVDLNREIVGAEHAGGSAQGWTTTSTSGVVKPRVPTWEQWAELKTFLSLSDEMDAEVWRLNGRKGKPGDAWDEREKIGEAVVNGEEGTAGGYKNGIASLRDADTTVKRVIDITAPATPLARQWDGWGTALKPSHEPIIVVRKPLIGTVADNVERYGTGGINIDGCRIAEDGYAEKALRKYSGVINTEDSVGHGFMTSNGGKIECQRPEALEKGRFPANCVTTDDDAFYSPYFNVSPAEVSKKASKRDRGEGNTHPTVKPSDLMAWLVRLVTPPGGTVLDPFAGSGSTLVAAKREGFGFIGIEREAEYTEIIEARTGEAVRESVSV